MPPIFTFFYYSKVMKVHFLYWCINFTIFWRCKVTYYNYHGFYI